ncbi:MAG TPA: hypothetical protein VGN15_08710 [Ktedonobacteraceae bacterium]|nr:hypothetical protein [Ktedonobacteraceae bacterium]
MKWIQTLLEHCTAAEASAIRHLSHCQQSWNNCSAAAKESAAHKEKLADATKHLKEAEAVRSTNWVAGAILELIALKSVSIEKRLHLPPSVLEWVDDVTTT